MDASSCTCTYICVRVCGPGFDAVGVGPRRNARDLGLGPPPSPEREGGKKGTGAPQGRKQGGEGSLPASLEEGPRAHVSLPPTWMEGAKGGEGGGNARGSIGWDPTPTHSLSKRNVPSKPGKDGMAQRHGDSHARRTDHTDHAQREVADAGDARVDERTCLGRAFPTVTFDGKHRRTRSDAHHEPSHEAQRFAVGASPWRSWRVQAAKQATTTASPSLSPSSASARGDGRRRVPSSASNREPRDPKATGAPKERCARWSKTKRRCVRVALLVVEREGSTDVRGDGTEGQTKGKVRRWEGERRNSPTRRSASGLGRWEDHVQPGRSDPEVRGKETKDGRNAGRRCCACGVGKEGKRGGGGEEEGGRRETRRGPRYRSTPATDSRRRTTRHSGRHGSPRRPRIGIQGPSRLVRLPAVVHVRARAHARGERGEADPPKEPYQAAKKNRKRAERRAKKRTEQQDRDKRAIACASLALVNKRLRALRVVSPSKAHPRRGHASDDQGGQGAGQSHGFEQEKL
eukprot:scaffold2844_cov326-Pavlova_lutheri.AAC.21